ncbi:hypothetical protein AYO38_02020 [bacterium SCGC AG-212-C10]|nr:hypothetical protein AYO38_02020 [bacterium SCGC AG-212-C10]
MNRRKLKFGGILATVAAAAVPLTIWGAGMALTALPAGNENTSIIVQNVGSANATLASDYYLPDGSIIEGASLIELNVPTGGTRTFAQALNTNLGAGYRGVGVVSSDQPINALLVRDILGGGTANNHSYSIVNAQATGGSKLALPIMLDEFTSEQYNSRASVVNTGTDTACIKVSYYLIPNIGGSATTAQTVVDSPTGQTGCSGGGRALAPGGQLTFGRAGTGVTQFPAATRNNQMAALIEVLNPSATTNIAASVDLYRSDGNRLLGGYNAFVVNEAAPTSDDVGTDVVVPLAIKHSSGFYSVVGVQNVGTAPADVNIQYIGATEGGTPVNKTVTLPAVSNVAFHSSFDPSFDVPIDFIGYARVTSAQPVAALLVRGKLTSFGSGINEPIYGAVNGVPTDQAGTSWNLPLIFRRYAQTFAGSIGYNNWIQVQVADGTSASVTIRMVGDPNSGCPVGPYTVTQTITGSKVFYMNADTENGFPTGGAPACFWGGAQVTSSKPTIVISNVTSDSYAGGDNEGMYNAFKAQ